MSTIEGARWLRWLRVTALAGAALVAVVACPLAGRASAGSPLPAAGDTRGACLAGETGVVVETRLHLMHLCARGEAERTYAVALGARGAGKQHQGDNRTPLGVYPLGAPRASRFFHVFVPVEYPTPAQVRMGFSGGAIGIHGPPRGVGGLARLALLVHSDWTAGCIAVATDDEIDEVARWVRGHGVRGVRLVV